MKACRAIESRTYWKCTMPNESLPWTRPIEPNESSSPPPPFYTYRKCTNPASCTMPNPSFEKLNETNYNDWRYVMAALLVEKDLWDVVDGTETQPAGSVKSGRWWRRGRWRLCILSFRRCLDSIPLKEVCWYFRIASSIESPQCWVLHSSLQICSCLYVLTHAFVTLHHHISSTPPFAAPLSLTKP